MVHKLDGNSEIGANVWSEIGLCCFSHFISKAAFNLKKMFSFTLAQRVLSYHLLNAPRQGHRKKRRTAS